MANGIVETGQAEVTLPPSQGTHVVRLVDLQQAIATVYQMGIDVTPHVSSNQAQNGKAAFVDADGALKVATNTYAGSPPPV